ncbi:MAG: hypothetical protein PHE43_00525 [Candidatus Nanoarchaeia archaeon]|nr:hypothetical protein [Candidatus Nanoarchaeia archaeon]
MKKLILILCLILVSGFVSASQVCVLDFDYNNGDLNLLNHQISNGFSPDYKLSEGDYSVDSYNFENQRIRRINFDIPLTIFSDVSNEDIITGSVEKLNQVKFSLIIPCPEEIKELKINKGSEELIDIKVPTTSKKSGLLVWILVLIAIILIFLFVMFSLRKRDKFILNKHQQLQQWNQKRF